MIVTKRSLDSAKIIVWYINNGKDTTVKYLARTALLPSSIQTVDTDRLVVVRHHKSHCMHIICVDLPLKYILIFSNLFMSANNQS